MSKPTKLAIILSVIILFTMLFFVFGTNQLDWFRSDNSQNKVWYVSVPWDELETQKDIFDPRVLEDVLSEISNSDLPVVLAFTAFEQSQMRLPKDLMDRGIDLSNEDVIRRYKTLLSYVDANFGHHKVQALVWGSDVNNIELSNEEQSERAIFSDEISKQMKIIGARYPNGVIVGDAIRLSDKTVYVFDFEMGSNNTDHVQLVGINETQ